jgi:2'-5' RNA ligase
MGDLSVRSFIAIELDDHVKNELSILIDTLRMDSQKLVRWVKPAGIHVTLKFLGSIKQGMLQLVQNVLAGVCLNTAAFNLSLSGLGFFPGPRKPRVLWIGMGGDLEELARLQSAIDSGLSKLGFEAEKREFSPHITLGRLDAARLPQDITRFTSCVLGLKYEAVLKIRVDRVSLMRSQLLPTGAVYSRLAEFDLRR